MTSPLPLFHRLAARPVIVAGSGDGVEARRRLVEKAGGLPVGPDDGDARLAFLAGEGVEPLAAELRARGVLVNVADRPDLCDFLVPAMIDRAPVQIAVGTGGASAGLAKALRMRLEALLPASLGALASALGDARARLRAHWPDAADRRRAIDAALGEGGPLDPLQECDAAALAAWLADPQMPHKPGVVELHIASDDPEDLTLRAARLMGQADLIAFEPGISPAILARARADAARRAIATGQALDQTGQTAGLVVILRRQAAHG